MANGYICDDILNNILARLPGKPLLRFRCVSKHWNRLISDPYFMKSRSRRMILLPFQHPLVVVDANVPVEDKAHSLVTIRSPPEHQKYRTQIYIIGTLNGIVVLALLDRNFGGQLILYNPLTCASKILVVIDPPATRRPYIFGFVPYENDLKIVRLEIIVIDNPDSNLFKCDVFDLKTSSWSTPFQYLKHYFNFGGDAGMFLDGFLYWSTSIPYFGILALNVNEMVFSKVKLPKGIQSALPLLGSIEGRLCMIHYNWTNLITLDLWLMKDDHSVPNTWLKVCSLSRCIVDRCIVNRHQLIRFYPICILGDGKILILLSDQLFIYDTSKDSYKVVDGLPTYDIHSSFCLRHAHSIEYVESLMSPSDFC